MDYKKCLADYALEHEWLLDGGDYRVVEGLTAKIDKDGIRFDDNRDKKCTLLFEENTNKDKPRGKFYCARTWVFFDDLDSIVEYMVSKEYLKQL